MNDGAIHAINASHSSLLAVGITEVRGTFNRGDVVRIVDSLDFEIGRGITAYSSSDIAKTAGMKTESIRKNFQLPDEVIHRDYMVLFKETHKE
ncbi:MAG: PUA domain-containing protein [Bdellovibrionales bacterium]